MGDRAAGGLRAYTAGGDGWRPGGPELGLSGRPGAPRWAWAWPDQASGEFTRAPARPDRASGGPTRPEAGLTGSRAWPDRASGEFEWASARRCSLTPQRLVDQRLELGVQRRVHEGKGLCEQQGRTWLGRVDPEVRVGRAGPAEFAAGAGDAPLLYVQHDAHAEAEAAAAGVAGGVRPRQLVGQEVVGQLVVPHRGRRFGVQQPPFPESAAVEQHLREAVVVEDCGDETGAAGLQHGTGHAARWRGARTEFVGRRGAGGWPGGGRGDGPGSRPGSRPS